ncbi:3-phosphoshikimate 1-carboxyvinyltransferase [Streptomyces sp. NPDC018964]|uniref:3-phosphoshikimate 1-carboxyvinyltransferase n=1 Tax=unclassified Streptomyces TaxID=2593676 RepID=UPI00379670BC
MTTLTRPLTARIPGSKSITNRALLLAAAAHGTSRLRAPLVSDDTVAFRKALSVLGVTVRTDDDGGWTVTGLGGGPRGTISVWCADAGTAARFLPVLAAAGRGDVLFDGSAQLRARPLRPLVDALRSLGVETVSGPAGGLPLLVRADGLPGGEVELDSSTSSQYLTGLLMSAPLARGPLTVVVRDLVSSPYVEMTLELMRRFGAQAHRDGERLLVRPGAYRAVDLAVEPDASTASYFFAAAAVTGTAVTVPGLGGDSLQGDVAFTDVLRLAGARVRLTEDAAEVAGTGGLRGGFTVDMGEISDTFMTLAAVAPLADAPVTITGVAHARLKESDRIAAVARNLRALGIRVDEGPDRLTVHPGTPVGTTIACHRDHRIAMAFSVLALRVPGITLDDPGCVSKTFPGFHQELARLFGPPAGPGR